jgi:hypothetical protein
VLLQTSSREKIWVIISLDGGDHAIGRRRPIHLHGYVAFSHCRTLHTALELHRTETTATDTMEHFPENRGIIERSACRVVFVTTPAQTLTLKWT